MSTPLTSHTLDTSAVARWPTLAGAHLLGVGLVAAVLVALPVAPTDLDRHQLPKEAVVHLATWLAALLVRPGALRLPGRALAWGLYLLVGGSVLAGVFATNPWLAFRSVSLTITLVVAFITARQLALCGAGGILRGWAVAAAACAAMAGLAQAYGASSIFFANTRIPGGTFGNRNFLAHYAALSLPLLMIPTLTTRKRFGAFLGMVLAGSLLMLIILTRSRAAWLGVFLGGTVFYLALRRARPDGLEIVAGRAPRLCIGLVLGVLLAVALPNALDWRSPTPYRDTLGALANGQEGSGHGRMVQYQNSLKLAARHPLLGVGPGNWPIRYSEVAPPTDPSWVAGDVIPLNPWPSSDWIAYLSERGPAVVVGVVLIGVALAIRGYRGLNAGGDRALAGAGLMALLVTLAVEGTFDVVTLLAAPGALIAIVSALLVVRSDGGEVVLAEDLPPAAKWGKLIPVVLGLILFRSALQTGAYVVAGNGRSQGRLELAARVDPGSYALQIALANRGSCAAARAALKLAPLWPAPRSAVRRCPR